MRRGDKVTNAAARDDRRSSASEMPVPTSLDWVAGSSWRCSSVGLLLGWVWRFRRELWHRNNALLLIGADPRRNCTRAEGRRRAARACRSSSRPRPSAMLLAILLDAGVATVLTSSSRCSAGALNRRTTRSSTRRTSFLGGLAGIIAIRRGDRLQVFVQAGLAVAVVERPRRVDLRAAGAHDLSGVLQLSAPRSRRRRARRSRRSARSPCSAACSGS